MKKLFYLLLALNTFTSLQSFAANTNQSTPIKQEEVIKEIQSLGKRLKSKLQQAMKQSPIHALKVCNLEAVKLTNQTHNKNINVGRVSLKNRNPHNKPKEWMMKTIKAYENNELKKKYEVVAIDHKTNGIIMPIKTGGLCLKCHGKNISSDLQAEINRLYPQDLATGYGPNEIRGYFFATYPK